MENKISRAYNNFMSETHQIKESKVAVILGFVRSKNEPLLINAIKTVKNQTYKNFDIFIYDNSEVENSLLETRTLFPEVTIYKNKKNNGFAGGNNTVMREVLKKPEYKYLVLLNDDTQPCSEWLENLVNAAKKSKAIGAVTSKLLFFEPFVRIIAKTQTFNPSNLNIGDDIRDLGVKFYVNESGFENSKYSKKFPRIGFYGMEGDYSWTKDNLVIDLPIGENLQVQDYELVLSIEGSEFVKDQTLEVTIGDYSKTINISKDKSVYKISIPNNVVTNNQFNLIQNAGSGITAQFNGYDIGSMNGEAEIDKGQYDKVKEVEMICGAAVIFKASVLRKVGILDEYFFVYYEDSDLSLRIRHKGYKLMYAPKAIVRHMHAGSSTEYSPLFTYHVWKNKPAFVLKNFGIRPSIYAIFELKKILYRELRNAARYRFKNGYHNSRLKVILKSLLTFYMNIPLIFLKKFNIVKSK